MGKEKKALSIDFVGSSLEIAEKLAAFVKAFMAGTVCISSGAEELVLKPQNAIHLELEASCKGDKEKIGFKLKWHKSSEIDMESVSSFTISETPNAVDSEPLAEEAVQASEVEEPKSKKEAKKPEQSKAES